MVFDIIFIALLGWALYRGFSKGLIVQAATLAALILGIFGAIRFSDLTSQFLLDNTSLSTEYLPLIAFAITFIGIVVLVHLSAKLVERLIKAVALGFVNRILGAAFNILKFSFIISVVLVVLNTIHAKHPFLPEDKVEESALYRPLSSLAPMVFPYLNFDQLDIDRFPTPPRDQQV